MTKLSHMIPSETFNETASHHVGWRIVVLDRGWVLVGDVTSCGDKLLVNNSSVIRQWGTTCGLGQLVTGPLKETVIDPLGAAEVPARAVIFMLVVSADDWQ